jgi:hypothetical protein
MTNDSGTLETFQLIVNEDELTAATWALFFFCHIFSPRGKMGLALMSPMLRTLEPGLPGWS